MAAHRSTDPTLSRLFVTSLLAAALLCVPAVALARGHAVASPTPAATPTPPPENPAITRIARREFVAWQAGIVDRAHYAAVTQSKLTPAKIAATSKALGSLGPLTAVAWLGYLGIEDGPKGVTGYIYRMRCANATVFEELTIDPDGKIDGIMFRDKLQ